VRGEGEKPAGAFAARKIWRNQPPEVLQAEFHSQWPGEKLRPQMPQISYLVEIWPDLLVALQVGGTRGELKTLRDDDILLFVVRSHTEPRAEWCIISSKDRIAFTCLYARTWISSGVGGWNVFRLFA
jgi:hypothetical protein